MTLSIVILAAGQGKRMKSALPKVLHTIGGKPMLCRVLETARQLHPKRLMVVYGQSLKTLQQATDSFQEVEWVHQPEQLGTGDAVAKAMPFLNQDKEEGQVLILYGDVPLLSLLTLQKLIEKTKKQSLGLITAEMDCPTGFGRILRNATGKVQKIVEERDADVTVKQIKEFNTGILLMPTTDLKQWLSKITPNNQQREYYLTDIVQMAAQEGFDIVTMQPEKIEEVLGINNRLQQHELERKFQQREVEKLLESGVQVLDMSRVDIRGELIAEEDVTIDVNVVFEGKNRLGKGAYIGAHVFMKNCELGAGVTVQPFCHLEGATIGEGAVIGPFARLRPGTDLKKEVRIGNFVEVKNAHVGEGSKINHLSYIGDAKIGKRVNIGAGTITCNFDGAKKHVTTIEDDVSIGSDTQLVAPVTIGKGATLAAGTTLTQNAPSGKLTLTQRLEQRTVENWARPTKERG